MRKYLHLLLALSFIVSWSYVLSSCSDDDDEKKKEKKDDKAGYFWLKNLRTNEGAGISEIYENGNSSYKERINTIDCELGDTLVIKFTPKSSYKDEKIVFRPVNILDNTSQVGDTVLTSSLSIGEHTLVAKAVCQMEGYNLSAQYSFSFKVMTKKVFDSEAGSFKITNLSTGEEINGHSYQCFAGDTLEVLFTPKKEYEFVPFEIEGGYFKKISDNLFVVPDLKTSVGNGISVGKTVDFQTVYNNNKDSILMCKHEFSMITYVEEADVTYTLNLTRDLLQFVTATLSYTDDNGRELSFTLKNEDWTTETFEDDGKSVEMTYYKFPLHYTKLDRDFIVKASYSIIENVALTKDSYDFGHRLKWGPANVAGASYTNISIDINVGGDSMVKAEDVAKYLEQLTNEPDVVKVHIGKRDRSIKDLR